MTKEDMVKTECPIYVHMGLFKKHLVGIATVEKWREEGTIFTSLQCRIESRFMKR